MTVIGEGDLLPAVTVSVMRRSLPRIGVGSIVNGDRYAFASDLASVQYRATIGKRFGPLDLGAGAGWSDYSADAEIAFVNPVSGTQEPSIQLAIKDSRTVGFVDGGLALGSFYLIGELGLQAGKDLGLVTAFASNDPKENRLLWQRRPALRILATCSISRSWTLPSASATWAGAGSTPIRSSVPSSFATAK